jgi:hypothetical protein
MLVVTQSEPLCMLNCKVLRPDSVWQCYCQCIGTKACWASLEAAAGPFVQSHSGSDPGYQIVLRMYHPDFQCQCAGGSSGWPVPVMPAAAVVLRPMSPPASLAIMPLWY